MRSFVLSLFLFFPTAYNNVSAQQVKPVSRIAEESALEQKMLDHIDKLLADFNKPTNSFASEIRVAHYDSLMKATKDPSANLTLAYRKGMALLEAGKEKEATLLFDRMATFVKDVPQSRKLVLPALGLAFMRLAERNNCINNHSAEACIMPIRGKGVHVDKTPAESAIQVFELALKEDPGNLDSRWLLNMAYMLTGGYPAKVPPAYLIPGLNAPSKVTVKPFKEMAAELGIDVKSRSGGMIVDDFNNDGHLDIMSSAWGLDDPMSFYKNNGDGTFTDMSVISRISKFKGGLNICQVDYNNDGWMDIFIMRGGWQGQLPGLDQPNSLVRNNGDGTFTDVTYAAGIFSEHPTQTATWNDFNNDGWLDVFIGNETISPDELHPCELFINNRNGTFTDVAPAMGIKIIAYVKGVTSGDYDNDGWADIFISTLGGNKVLLHNEGGKGNGFSFTNTAANAGFANSEYRTFPTWFFDYNNDGWLDIFMCNYEFDRPLSYYAAKEAIAPSADPAGKIMLFLNNKNGTFTNVSSTMDVNQTSFAMGSNFGDIDNDGYLDIYLGTGNPSYQSLIPNRMYKNMEGKNFVDVTNAARVGHLQKGHGVAFADMDNNGTQDISTELGGAFIGDAYNNAFFLNPGQGNNNWIALKLEGSRSNRQSVGAKITVTITEQGKKRIIYREVNSGGSFGCSPLRQSIGIGTAGIIDEIKITWPTSGITQVYTQVAPNRLLKITEGKQEPEVLPFKAVQLKGKKPAMQHMH